MPVRWLWVMAIALAGTGCDEGCGEASTRREDSPPSPPRPDPALVAEGRALVERFECNRCHLIDGVDPPEPTQNCVGCHRDVLAGDFPATEEDLAEWAAHIVDLVDAPRLERVGARLSRAWIAEFLVSPRDLRPHLRATMPRLAIDAEEARAVAAFLTRDVVAPGHPEPRDDVALIARGRRLFGERACVACHVFRDREAPERAEIAPDPAHDARLAPNLGVTRERFRRDRLAAWIANPDETMPDTTMPNVGLSMDDAEALAAYVLFAEIDPEPRPAVPEMLPLLERRVTFEEVDARVFRRLCRHCHADADLAMGDGGPGNRGGFGFPARGLNLTNYEGAAAGVFVDGQRESIYAVDDSGVPRIVRALRARQLEEAGQIDPEIHGMPLGHPALSAEDVQLVASWVAQGRPRR